MKELTPDSVFKYKIKLPVKADYLFPFADAIMWQHVNWFCGREAMSS